MSSFVDLRSDTVTRPTPAMREAMLGAEVGDDVYGEDPTVLTLEAEVAALLGKEAALYVPSGTMANQLAIAVHTRPGETVLTEVGSHCAIFEAGAAGALSGVQIDYLPREARFADAELLAALKPEGLHDPTTTLLVVENTHNVGGGRVLGVDEMARIGRTAQRAGLARHVDGARLWNAAAALGVPEAALVAEFDTAAVCFSKGLGAPVGSALVGPRALIERARKVRKRWGGGMRQAGVIAAGALHAVRHHRARLVEDHRRAAQLAAHLRGLAAQGAPLEVAYPDPGTNLVYFRFTRGAAAEHQARLADEGVRVTAMGAGWLRAVLHLDVSAEGVERAAAALTAAAAKAR